jgi:hypothetical protein
MLTESQNIDHIFNSALADYGENMPDYSWDIINTELQEKRKKKKMIVYWTVAASLTVFLSFILGYYSRDSKQETQSGLISQTENNFKSIRPANETKSSQAVNSSYDFSEVKKENDIKNRPENILLPVSEKKEPVLQNQDELTAEKEVQMNFVEINHDQKKQDTKNDTVEKISPEKKILLRNELTDIKEEDILKEEINKNGSDPEILADNHSKWSVGGQVSSGLSAVNRLSENYTLGSFLIPADNISENTPDTRISSYSAGVRTSYEIRKKLDIQSGIMLTRYENKFSNTEIPVLLNYTLLDRKFQINTMGGPSIGFLNSNAQKAMNIQAVLGLEGVYSINKRFSVNLTPLIKYPVPVNQNIITDYNFRYFGFSTGLNYKL